MFDGEQRTDIIAESISMRDQIQTQLTVRPKDKSSREAVLVMQDTESVTVRFHRTKTQRIRRHFREVG
jgi:hypothetical protein